MTEKYKPKTSISTFEKVMGEAQIQISKEKGKCRLIFRDKEICEKPVILKLEDCPDEVREGKYIVTLSKDKTQMFNLRPINGLYEFRTLRFSAPKDKPPVPKINQQWNYFYFTPILIIISGKEEGLTVPYNLHYNFGETQNEKGESIVMYTKGGANAKHTPLLDEYLTIAGAWEAGELKYADNLLPQLEKRVLRANKSFKGIMKGGWIDKLFSNEDMPTEEDLSEEEKADWNEAE